jgi:hypothetical protein
LLVAIRQVEPGASLAWKRQWQSDWLSPEGWVMQVKQAERDVAKAQILQEVRLQALGNKLGLVPQWDQLEKVTLV